jgi:hypothetical protein
MKGPKIQWLKRQKFHKDFKIVECKPFDDMLDFELDASAYTLIRINRATYTIHVAIVRHDHKILREYIGKRPQDIYHNIFKDMFNETFHWFTIPDHMAYLGKELKKAEICLVNGSDYNQE